MMKNMMTREQVMNDLTFRHRWSEALTLRQAGKKFNVLAGPFAQFEHPLLRKMIKAHPEAEVLSGGTAKNPFLYLAVRKVRSGK